MNKPIIIIGGMGPQASIELHRSIIEKSVSSMTRTNDYPYILHASIPTPDFIEDAAETERAVDMIKRACESMPTESASGIGMVCNTAHLLIDQIPELQKDNFVNMVDVTVRKLRASGSRRVGILASPYTIDSGLYKTPLTSAGIDVVDIDDDERSVVADIIRKIVSGTPPIELRPDLTELALSLVDKGADIILLGCTELPLVGIDSTIPSLSSLDVLADALIGRQR